MKKILIDCYSLKPFTTNFDDVTVLFAQIMELDYLWELFTVTDNILSFVTKKDQNRLFDALLVSGKMGPKIYATYLHRIDLCSVQKYLSTNTFSTKLGGVIEHLKSMQDFELINKYIAAFDDFDKILNIALHHKDIDMFYYLSTNENMKVDNLMIEEGMEIDDVPIDEKIDPLFNMRDRKPRAAY
uniref:Uncharacterized protein n=1 Tax=viral metagenome TaxID=1070528 RepID=A0A6C0CCC5_9ZZZZ